MAPLRADRRRNADIVYGEMGVGVLVRTMRLNAKGKDWPEEKRKSEKNCVILQAVGQLGAQGWW